MTIRPWAYTEAFQKIEGFEYVFGTILLQRCHGLYESRFGKKLRTHDVKSGFNPIRTSKEFEPTLPPKSGINYIRKRHPQCKHLHKLVPTFVRIFEGELTPPLANEIQANKGRITSPHLDRSPYAVPRPLLAPPSTPPGPFHPLQHPP